MWSESPERQRNVGLPSLADVTMTFKLKWIKDGKWKSPRNHKGSFKKFLSSLTVPERAFSVNNSFKSAINIK